MKLTTTQHQLVRLYQRNPKDADGWATVSAAIWPLMTDLPLDLFEKEGDGRGGRIRTNETGAIVIQHL